MATSILYFTANELQSYLPAGWMAPDTGEWVSGDNAWRVKVTDGADQEWTLEIGAREVDKIGRAGALRQAIDRLCREGLG